jgi:hypothetical protein
MTSSQETSSSQNISEAIAEAKIVKYPIKGWRPLPTNSVSRQLITEPQIFFASGMKGKNVRANGLGGVLSRGWYVRSGGRIVFGPASFRDCRLSQHGKDAEKVARNGR